MFAVSAWTGIAYDVAHGRDGFDGAFIVQDEILRDQPHRMHGIG
jgi:hypothetical protein